MAEFEALLERTHAKGLKVLIDFVPNHVSRDYGKINPTPGHPVLGAEDDKNIHWTESNDFIYYPGEHLTLPTPCPEGMEPYAEFPAMATGNNCYSSRPDINDWFETVKINYCDWHTPTWDKMLDIIRFWAAKGVDGFRCDMVELVPPQFFKWMIETVKKEYPSLIFVAEVYKKDLYSEYIRNVGFDYLYDKSGLYDTLREIVEKNTSDNGMPVELWQSAIGITRNWQFLGDLQPYMLNFLENHDEQRFGSDFFGKDPLKTNAALYTSLFLNTAPFMLYFGEEVGERAMDKEGFSGRDGRSTIFDWWSIASVQRLRKIIHKGTYTTLNVDKLVKAGMTREEAKVFVRFADALRTASKDEAFIKGTTYDLNYCNYSSNGFNKDKHFAFLRDYGNHTVLVVVNFSPMPANMKIKIPGHAFEWMEIKETETLYPGVSLDVTVSGFDGTIITLE
jgi:glycosidase